VLLLDTVLFNNKKKEDEKDILKEICSVLDKEGKTVYWDVFDKNNKTKIKAFFNDYLIKAIWRKLCALGEMSSKHRLGETAMSGLLDKTFGKIKEDLDDFIVPIPQSI
jgi:ubiquinone/menaquinone biosynthesis C-methylase UbiE